MFWSKIWFFVIAVVGAVALSIALLMPRPAQRVQAQEIDPNRVNNGRAMIQLLLRDNARKWVDLASVFARITAPQGQPSLKLDQVLETASGQEQIAAASHETARSTLEYILSQITTAQKPEFVIALDDTGRVVARVGVDDKSWGDNISGYFLVRDALRGYLRDDLWFLGDKLYRVAAAPVIARGSFDGRMVNRYVGAIVVGDEVSLELAKELSGIIGSCEGGETGDARCEQGVAFFVKEQTMAASDTVVFAEDIYAKYQEAKAAVPAGEEFKPPPPFEVSSSGKDYLVAVRQLPGEVAAQDGYYAVFAEKSAKVGFAATLKRVVRQDVAFGNFPWIIIILLFLLATAGGLFLMYVEADKPLRKLMVDAVTLGKGETAKLDEDKHKGRFGSIARSVNIALEKLAREAKASRKDLGAVLGPPPDDSVLGGGARSLPSPLAGGPAPFAPPPPSDFSFDPPPSNPVPSAPMHLGPSGSPPLRGEAPKGPGFDFDMPAPPPPAPPQPSIGGTTRGAPPPPMPATPPRRTAAVAAAPPPMPMGSPPPVAKPPPPRATSAIRTPLPHVPSLDDDILAPNLDDDMVEPSGGGRNDFGGATVVADPSQDLLAASADPDATYFREVFQDFVELKQKCGEPIDNLTYEKFSAKLRNNREQLINKYGCKAVKFQVYVKDGKAALKASPVK